MAKRPEHIPHRGWSDIVWRTGGLYFGDRVGFVAGGVTFFTPRPLFPPPRDVRHPHGLFADPADARAGCSSSTPRCSDSIAEFPAGRCSGCRELQ